VCDRGCVRVSIGGCVCHIFVSNASSFIAPRAGSSGTLTCATRISSVWHPCGFPQTPSQCPKSASAAFAPLLKGIEQRSLEIEKRQEGHSHRTNCRPFKVKPRNLVTKAPCDLWRNRREAGPIHVPEPSLRDVS